MFARFTQATVDPKQRETIDKIGRDSIAPVTKQQAGFAGVFLATGDNGQGVFVSLWDSKEALLKNESSGYYQEQVAKLKPYLARPTVRHVGEVAAQAFQAMAPKAARLTVAPLKPGKEHEAVKLARDILNMASKQPGFCGWCGIVSDDSKALAISLWDSMASLEKSASYLQEVLQRLKEYATGAAEQTLFDSVAVYEIKTPATVR